MGKSGTSPASRKLRRQAWLLVIGPGTAEQWFSPASRFVPPARHGDRCWLTLDERRVLRPGVHRGAEPEAAGPGSAADREPAAAGDVLVPAARRYDRGPGDRPAGRARLPRRCHQGPGQGERGRRPGPGPAAARRWSAAGIGPPAWPAQSTSSGRRRPTGAAGEEGRLGAAGAG